MSTHAGLPGHRGDSSTLDERGPLDGGQPPLDDALWEADIPLDLPLDGDSHAVEMVTGRGGLQAAETFTSANAARVARAVHETALIADLEPYAEPGPGVASRAGEIIGATTTTFTAQSYWLNDAPAFGALLRVPAGQGGPAPAGGRGAGRGHGVAAYYAICIGVETGSIEPGRHAVAWGHAEDAEDDDIYRRQPQLAHVLRTTFDALLVGYVPAGPDSGGITQRIPPTPPRLHAAVHIAAPREIAFFNGSLTYLRLLLRAGLASPDDTVAAAILHAYDALGRDRSFLVEAARNVARLLGAEHERVMTILELLNHEG